MSADETMSDLNAVEDVQPVEVDDPQPSGSGTQTGSSSGPAHEKKIRKRAAAAFGPNPDPVNAKMPSLRDLITQAYDAKVAETKASRDPRLQKGKLMKNLKGKEKVIEKILTTYPKNKFKKNLKEKIKEKENILTTCLLYTSPSPRD